MKERTYLLNEKNELLSREVLDRKRIEEQLKFQITALESAEIPMFVAEMDGTISWINHAFTTVTGFSPEEVVGKNANIYIANEKAAVFSDAFWQTNRARGVWHNESENRRRDGILYFQEATVTPVRDVSGQITHFVCVFQDITERKLYQAYLLKQSALAEIELAINQPNELQFVLHQIVEVTSRYLPASAGACVVLWDKSKKEYWVGDATLENFDEKPLSHMLCDPHGISYLVNHKRQPVIISNMALDPSEINNTFLIGGIFALAAYPLQVEEELLGILYVFENHPRIYTDWDQDFLTALANRAALAITRIKLYETLQAAKDAAEETIRAKSLLLANVSHEFRTPISAVIGLSELLLESKLDQNQKDLVTTMHSSAERLSALVNDILDFSKMEAKKLTLDVQSFDLRQCIESCLDLIAPRVDQNGLALAYFVDENIPKEIIGDPVRLGQVLTNLLSNAEKFTNSGSIIVNATIQEIHRATGMLGNKIKQNQILFSVKDTGIGIPPERTHLLYDSFTQLDPSATRKFGGTGLGLAICKQLVGLMGGKIWVESSGVPGQGSTFYFSIPFTPVNEVNAPHLNHDQNSLSGKLVLILSRSIVYQSAFQKYLNFWGLDTVIFENENDALKWIEINSLPQLAILDCRNSVLAFNQFSQRLNQITKPKTLPVIIFSSTLETIDEQNDFQIIGRLKNPIKPSLLYDLLISADSHTQQESKKIISDEQVLMQYPLEILVGEDDTANLKALTLRLKKLGYNPEAATDGKQVIQLLAERSFDVLILDLHMPEMDGLEITRYIRSTFPSNRQPYIVILTADTFLDVQDSVVDAGVNYFLTKPITGKELAKVLRNVVANQGEPISKLEQNQPLPDQPGYESVINMEILEDFMQAMGEDAPASIAEILHSFFENAPKLIVEIKIATANQDWNQLKWLAHSLKGNCELLGVVQLVQLCKSIGNDISNEKYESLAAQSALLEDAYLQAKKALENTFNLIDWR
ncbi:MAG: ATP-binding protein [Anaerolineaceae bacterium]|nr:ATP-binding protein [Anaerolineaceae bacterium]